MPGTGTRHYTATTKGSNFKTALRQGTSCNNSYVGSGSLQTNSFQQLVITAQNGVQNWFTAYGSGDITGGSSNVVVHYDDPGTGLPTSSNDVVSWQSKTVVGNVQFTLTVP